MSTIHNADQCEPNLVPILDMVFQLITFFMLVVNFKAVVVDKELALPVVGSAEPIDQENQGELLVLNLRNDGSVYARGALQPSLEVFLRTESRVLSNSNKSGQSEALPVTVVLRADRKTSFEKLLHVVDTCKANRFNKIDFVVVRTKETLNTSTRQR